LNAIKGKKTKVNLHPLAIAETLSYDAWMKWAKKNT
jgi:hypothetical protein